MLDSFENLEISSELIHGLLAEKITTPTMIQTKVIPLILQNKDLIVQSETGTGKTLAYLIPIFEKIKEPKKEVSVVIMTPTHELVIQIQRQVERLAQNSKYPVTSTPLIGNVNMERQIDKLKKKPRIIIGSAGRILELIKMKKISAASIHTVVLDEADRLLDKNNREDVFAVVRATAANRQLMLFSASISSDTIQKAGDIGGAFQIIKEEGALVIPESIEHVFFTAAQQDKIEILRKIIGITKPKKSLVFLNKNDQIENLLSKLQHHGFKVGALHGTFQKLERKKVMDDFRSGKISILIASDIAARGLQLDGITHVFNMDVPPEPKEYLHRVGRTGRNSTEGLAVSIVTEREVPLLTSIQHKYSFALTEKSLFKGEIG